MKRWVGLLTTVLWLFSGATAWAGTRTITVSGAVDDPQASVTVNDNPVTVTNGAFSTSVTLLEGANTITARATDPAGNQGSHAITITLDTIAPTITITSPQDGHIFGAP